MNIFRIFKKDKDKKKKTDRTEGDKGKIEETEEVQSKGPISWLKKKKQMEEDEKTALVSLAPYRVRQKLLIWDNGEGGRLYGYPIAMIPQPNDMYVILYKRRCPDFLEELLITIKEALFGVKERYRAVHVPAGCIGKSEDIITIYAHSFEIINNYTERAIPLEGMDPRKRQLYLIAQEESEIYRSSIEKIGNQVSNVIDIALQLNPAMKAYYGKEIQADKKRGSKVKEFAGKELEFTFTDFMEDLRRRFGGSDDRW